MILKLSKLDKPGRDVVSGLSLGYEADAAAGIPMREQVERIMRWHGDGWPVLMYDYHMLAILIGYTAAGRKTYTLEMPGFSL